MSEFDDDDMREMCLAAVSEAPQMHPLEAIFSAVVSRGHMAALDYDELEAPTRLSVTRTMPSAYTCVIRLKDGGGELVFEGTPSGSDK
jgi:hypothetical protein